ncbi:MAG: carboxypeptidase-like regulatory domain-containing protein, partial [Longimicrobiales bacterium]
TGVDPEDGVLTGNALRWSATDLGTFGTGESVTISSLPLGPRRINLVAIDSDTVTTSTFIDITIVPVTTGRITGTVSVYGHGYQGARLTLSTTPVRSATTDGHGVYAFDDVPAGIYVLTLEPPQYTSFPFTTRSVNVTGGSTTTVDFAGNIGLPAPQSAPR